MALLYSNLLVATLAILVLMVDLGIIGHQAMKSLIHVFFPFEPNSVGMVLQYLTLLAAQVLIPGRLAIVVSTMHRVVKAENLLFKPYVAGSAGMAHRC